MGPQTLTYNGDVTDIVGTEVVCSRLKLDGGLTYVRWVATDAEFDSDRGKTYVEWDAAQ